MTTPTLHPRPRWQPVLREQIRGTALAVRREALLFAGLLLLFTAVFLWTHYFPENPENAQRLDLTPEAALPLLFLSFLAPLAVWKDETPSRRTYLLAMPVERRWHQLAHSFAGWFWLMVALAAYLLWLLALARLTGGSIGEYRGGIGLVGGDLPREQYRELFLSLPANRWTVPAWQWAMPFVAATAAYLVGLTVVLASEHPVRWIVGIVGGYLLLMVLLDAADLDRLSSALERGIEGRYGLERLFQGTTDVTRPLTDAAGQAVRARNGGIALLRWERPDLNAWLLSVLVWGGVGGIGTWIAASRHRDA